MAKFNTAEYRKQQSDTMKRVIRERGGHWLKGIKWSEEAKRNQAAARVGRKLSEETKEKIGKAQIGEKNHMWKGGILHTGGYIYSYVSKNKYEKRSRMIMEKHLKRKLLKEEVVHHINGNRSDDRVENLIVLENQSKHLSLHMNSKKDNSE